MQLRQAGSITSLDGIDEGSGITRVPIYENVAVLWLLRVQLCVISARVLVELGEVSFIHHIKFLNSQIQG